MVLQGLAQPLERERPAEGAGRSNPPMAGAVPPGATGYLPQCDETPLAGCHLHTKGNAGRRGESMGEALAAEGGAFVAPIGYENVPSRTASRSVGALEHALAHRPVAIGADSCQRTD